jgi:hypothetical protein
MKKEEILKKAVNKAIENGFKQERTQHIYLIQKVFGVNTINKEWLRGFIFDHDFAKAFFCDNRELRVAYEGYCKDEECNTNEELDEAWRIKSWQYHLQQMVLEEDPIKYLEKFI